MSRKPKDILVVEDEEAHAEAVHRAFQKTDSSFRLTIVASLQEGLTYLEASTPDLIIADLVLPDGNGTDFLPSDHMSASFPLIVMTSKGNEQIAVGAIKAGALDYVVKSPETFSTMPRIAERALREWEHIRLRKQAEAELKESQERFRAVFESASDCVFIKDLDLLYTHVNPAMCEVLGLSSSQIIGRRAEDLYGAEVGRELSARDARVLEGESIEIEQIRPIEGNPLIFHDTLVPLRDRHDRIVGLCGISRNVTERRRLAGIDEVHAEQYPSKAMQATMKKARMASSTDSIVLLQGESGCGKDHLARWIHQHSSRANGPYFSINCAAISKELAESELFGHERGAFTGAGGLKKGLFELAEGGTILLNEIGELDLSLQSKLLAFLDTKSFFRVGGQKEIRVHARLIAATHRELETEIEEKRFLKPLFYRLSVFPIHVPPLRERIEDLGIIAEEFLYRLAVELQLNEVPALGTTHIEEMSQYPWPGNIRELRNVLERSLMLWEGGPFRLALPISDKSTSLHTYSLQFSPSKTVREVTDEVKTFMCAAALDFCRGNKKEAAKLIEISRDSFYRYIKKISKKSRFETPQS